LLSEETLDPTGRKPGISFKDRLMDKTEAAFPR
jgi:hypothetical protein